MNFEINLIFLIKAFFLHDQNVMIKTEMSWERKELFRWNKKHFSSFLKGFQWSKWRKFFFKRWKSDFNIVVKIFSVRPANSDSCDAWGEVK